MNELDESLAFALERALFTRATMELLLGPPYDWLWEAVPLTDYSARIESAREQEKVLSKAETRLRMASAWWDDAIEALLADVSFGQPMARLKFKADPARLRLFEGLSLKDRGREARHRQALDFESSWVQADATWTFKEGLTLEIFRERRRALRDLEEAYYAAVKDELFARASLRTQAAALNELSMDWYEAATITFAEDTVPGSLVRSIPTTYDPNRPPGPLVFTRHESAGAGHAELTWRSPRARRFTISVLRPGAGQWEPLLTDTEEHSWSAEDLSPGLWRFKGRTKNNFGEGTESDVAEVAIAATSKVVAA